MQSELNVEEVVNDRSLKVRLIPSSITTYYHDFQILEILSDTFPVFFCFFLRFSLRDAESTTRHQRVNEAVPDEEGPHPRFKRKTVTCSCVLMAGCPPYRPLWPLCLTNLYSIVILICHRHSCKTVSGVLILWAALYKKSFFFCKAKKCFQKTCCCLEFLCLWGKNNLHLQ